MRIADFRSFLRESANPFINLCSKFDNSNRFQQKIADLFHFNIRDLLVENRNTNDFTTWLF